MSAVAADPSLELAGRHVFITGGAGPVGLAAIQAFLDNGCYVTAFDQVAVDVDTLNLDAETLKRLFLTGGDLRVESSITAIFERASEAFGIPSILVVNAAIPEESRNYAIWALPVESWHRIHQSNLRATYLPIKHFMLCLNQWQELNDKQLENVAIVLAGPDVTSLGQDDRSPNISGTEQELVKSLQVEISQINIESRINAIGVKRSETTPGHPDESSAPTQTPVRLQDVASTMTFLASHKAAGAIKGQCILVGDHTNTTSGLQQVEKQTSHTTPGDMTLKPTTSLDPLQTSKAGRKRRMRICLSIDFDALSAYLGTGHTPENTLSDYSVGVFSANVGVGRLLRLFEKHGILDKVTWFLPGHSIETFPTQVRSIVDSGCEIGLHGYSHESAYAMTVEQEQDVLEKCIELTTSLQHGKKPVGYRAPLYQIRETTVRLLQSHGFLYDSSMNAHDSLPYLLPHPFAGEPPLIPDYSLKASSWMVPTPIPEQPAPGTSEAQTALVEIPVSWYTEDMTPMGFYPYSINTQGYVSVDVVEKMWWDQFEYLWENESWLDQGEGKDWGSCYPMTWHPESAGRAHIVGMIDRFISRLVEKMQAASAGEITFETMESVARSWKARA